jgi:adenylosuccinate lyase
LAILPIDNGRYGTKEMMDIFSEQKKVDYQLEIEGAAAISQSVKRFTKPQCLEKLLQKESSSWKQKVITTQQL